LWSAIAQDKNGLPWYGTFEEAELFVESMNISFDEVRDDMPYQFLGLEERKKLIHTVGVIAQARFDVTTNASGYTGIFASGCDSAIIRFSLAKPPGDSSCTDSCLTPGISVKFLRNGVPSATMLGLFNLLGQSSFNFFAHDLSTQPPDFGDWASFAVKALRTKFEEASQFPTMLGLSNVATYDQMGRNTFSPSFPFRVVFHPLTKWHRAFPDSAPSVPFTQQLISTLTSGPIFDVYAQTEPLNMNLVKIGQLSITSALTTSLYSDRHYFMQHQRWEDDAVFRPDWFAGALKTQANQRAAPAPGYTYPDLPWN